jgi:site-specific DNA recombinase
MATTSHTALIYTRISRDDTGEGKSNDRQRDACVALARARGWSVLTERFDDISVSASTGKERPAWNRVVQEMRQGRVDYVIAWQLDRVTRSTQELLSLALLADETGVPIVTASGDLDLSNDSGKLVGTMLSAVAEMEVARKAARQKLANQQRAAEGRPWASGWRAFGYEKDMTQIPAEVELIRRAAEQILSGGSLKSVAREWRALGVTTPRSSKGAEGWTHNGVKSILLNPRNAALNTYRGKVVGPGNWEPIYPQGTHHQLVALLTDPKRMTRQSGSSGRTASNLLTGIAVCGTCRTTVVAGSSNGKRVYKCKGEHITTPRDAADNVVVGSIIMGSTIGMPGAILDLPDVEDPTGITDEIARLESRQAAITTAFADDSISVETWNQAIEAINAAKLELSSRLTVAGRALESRAAHKLSIDKFKDMDLAERRRFLSRRAEITLHPRNRKRNVPMAQQVSLFVRSTKHGSERWEPVITEHPLAWRAMKAGRSVWSHNGDLSDNRRT